MTEHVTASACALSWRRPEPGGAAGQIFVDMRHPSRVTRSDSRKRRRHAPLTEGLPDEPLSRLTCQFFWEHGQCRQRDRLPDFRDIGPVHP